MIKILVILLGVLLFAAYAYGRYRYPRVTGWAVLTHDEQRPQFFARKGILAPRLGVSHRLLGDPWETDSNEGPEQ